MPCEGLFLAGKSLATIDRPAGRNRHYKWKRPAADAIAPGELAFRLFCWVFLTQ
jgi:hypothetical protein